MNKNTLKSIGAVVAGFLTVAVLSVVTDLIVEGVGILPPATAPQEYHWWHYAIALTYRSLFTAIGGYLTAHLAPNKPMRHVYILAVIGTIMGFLGSLANIDKMNGVNLWYPVLLVVSGPVFIWIGGKLYTK